MSDLSVGSNAPVTVLPPSTVGQPTKDESTMATAVYVLALFTGWVGPLIIWLMKREQSPFIDAHGKEVLNFQITAFIAYLICIPLMAIIIGFLIFPAVIVCAIVFCIRGAMAASRGEAYRFPLAIRLLK